MFQNPIFQFKGQKLCLLFAHWLDLKMKRKKPQHYRTCERVVFFNLLNKCPFK